MPRIKTVIKNGKVEMDFSDFKGKECIKEEQKLRAFLQLIGLSGEMLYKAEKEEVEEHVWQRSKKQTGR